MRYQGRIRLLAPTTPRGRERARSDVLLEKRKERAIRETHYQRRRRRRRRTRRRVVRG